MGVTGAAIATVFGQIVGGIVAIVLNVRRNRELDLRFRGFRPDGKLCGSILSSVFLRPSWAPSARS